MSGNGLRLISFDCGGIRSLSQLNIMDNIMHRIQYDLYPDDPDRIVLPCECFDAMGGSDTGGFIVIMLCKLRLSVEEAIEEFYKICQEVYINDLSAEARTNRLRECIEDLLRRRGFPVDLKMGKDDRVVKQGCPCFVVASLNASLDTQVKLRTYRTRAEAALKVTVVEAILATCATQRNFLPVVIGPDINQQCLVGGAMSTGNPCRELITEAYDLFGRDHHVATILSLGSGHPGLVSAPSLTARDEWGHALRIMANNCEQTAQDLKAQLGHLGIYYRFSVEHGLEQTYGVEVKKVVWINAQTRSYIQNMEVSRQIDNCVEDLRLRQGLVALEQLKHTGGGQPVYKGMPQLTSYFVLRKQIWERITDGIFGQDPAQERQKVLVLSGMGGCGKTQLVLYFVAEYRSRFKYSFFINGSTKESIQADIIQHVRAANAGYSQASFSEALSFFCNPQNQPSLLIYDNIDDIGINLTSLLPECSSGVIIITTRNRSRGQLASPLDLHIELGVMSSEEAVDVIFSSSRLNREADTVQAANIIANELGNLPVALVQAGSYIHETACSCNEYLERLRSHKSEMMYTPAGDRLQRSAYKAFDMSYIQLPVNVRNILHIIGCIHFANFPLQAISIAAKTTFSYDSFPFMKNDEHREAVKLLMETFCPSGEWDDYTMDQITRALQNYSLATFTRSGLFVFLRMHPLVNEWAFERLDTTNRTRFRRAATRLIVSASSEKTLRYYLVPHIDHLLSHALEILSINDRAAFGYILRVVQRLRDARRIWEDIYGLLVEQGPDYEIHVATAGMKLAETFQENLAEMENLEKRSIAIRERLLGVDHLETLDAKQELAGTYWWQGRKKEAEDLHIDVLTAMRAKSGPTNSKVIEVTGWLAMSYYRQGRYSEAEVLQNQVLNAQKEKLGDTHPDTVTSMVRLGFTYRSLHRYSEAEKLQERVLKVRVNQLGNTHMDTIAAMSNLGLIYRSQGRLSEGEELQKKVLEMLRDQLGDTHLNTISAMHELGATYYSQDRYAEAETLQKQVLSIRREQLGETHPDTLVAMNNLTWTYYYSGHLVQAKKLATQAEKVGKNPLGVELPHYKTTVQLLQVINRAETSSASNTLGEQT